MVSLSLNKNAGAGKSQFFGLARFGTWSEEFSPSLSLFSSTVRASPLSLITSFGQINPHNLKNKTIFLKNAWTFFVNFSYKWDLKISFFLPYISRSGLAAARPKCPLLQKRFYWFQIHFFQVKYGLQFSKYFSKWMNETNVKKLVFLF